MYVREICADLGYDMSEASIIYEDNKACISISEGDTDKKRTKHIAKHCGPYPSWTSRGSSGSAWHCTLPSLVYPARGKGGKPGMPVPEFGISSLCSRVPTLYTGLKGA